MSSTAVDRLARAEPAPGNAHGKTIIRPARGWRGLGLSELWQLRSICLVLARRNLMVRYRQTLIGAAWSLLQPLLLMTLFTLFFGLLGRLPSSGLPYPAFYFIGLLPWQMASKILTEGSASIVANSTLVNRVYFPRVYFPTSVALASMVDFALGSVVLVGLMIVFGIVPGLMVITLPFFIGIALMAGLGVAYWLSALNVAYRDITQMLPFLAQLWMFGSPLIYSSSLIPPDWRALYFLNPIALVVEGFRWAIANAPAPPIEAWILGPTVAVALFVSGYIFFRQREPNFSDLV